MYGLWCGWYACFRIPEGARNTGPVSSAVTWILVELNICLIMLALPLCSAYLSPDIRWWGVKKDWRVWQCVFWMGVIGGGGGGYQWPADDTECSSHRSWVAAGTPETARHRGTRRKKGGSAVRWKSWSLRSEGSQILINPWQPLGQGRRKKVEGLICYCRCLLSPFLVRRPPTCVEISSAGCLQSRRGGTWVGVGWRPVQTSIGIILSIRGSQILL